MTVEQFGDLRNDPSLPPAAGETESGYSKFVRMTELLARLKKDGVLRLGLEPSKGMKVAGAVPGEGLKVGDYIAAHKDGYEIVQGPAGKMDLMKSGAPSIVVEGEPSAKDLEELRECLRCKAESLRWEAVVTGTVVFYLRSAKGEERFEVPMRLRSVLDVLFYLGQGIEVPASHIKKEYVKVHWHEGKGPDWHVWRESTKDLLDIHCSLLPPIQAFVSIPYRGHWFYLDDSDVRSKDTFALLSLVFSLQAGEMPTTLPVLTIPISAR
jgi:hypothetical protein